jgi:hypothetical protein
MPVSLHTLCVGAQASLRRKNVLPIARKCATRPILPPSHSTTVRANESGRYQ